MFALVAAASFTLASLVPQALAQDRSYTVWSSVVLTRTGERTPEILGDAGTPTSLTSVGANQAHNAGVFFRDRYISGNRSDPDGIGSAKLRGLNADVYNSQQTYAIALEQQYNLGTAQAFLQGFYPPSTPGGNSSSGGLLASDNVLANGSYVDSPLGGYQYPQIRSAGSLDPNFIYLSGNLNCPAFSDSASEYLHDPVAEGIRDTTKGIYDAVGSAALVGVLDGRNWDYQNAYAIYDYLRYQEKHNSTVANALETLRNVESNTSYVDTLRWLADEQQFHHLGNPNAKNPLTKQTGLPGTTIGSISTIAGNTFAARVFDSLADSINYHDQGSLKLNLFFTDYHPFMSFFSLVGLPDLDPRFYGTPEFASSAVFELFSYTDSADEALPAIDDLWVRFSFRNGTASTDPLQSYPLFNRGPSETDMRWTDFRHAMQNIALASVGDWCTLCNATSIFCTAFDQSQMNDAVRAWLATHGLPSGNNNSPRPHPLSPTASGLVGAVVALAVAAIFFAIAMLAGGVRLHRPPPRPAPHAADLGGFKGARKMRSDEDLSLPPKGGAVVVAVDDASSPVSPLEARGHERGGSWELKPAAVAPRHERVGSWEVPSDAVRNMFGGPRDPGATSPRLSLGERRVSLDPFADPAGMMATVPREGV